MLREYSTLQLLYGFLPCYKLVDSGYKVFPSLFEVKLDAKDHYYSFEERLATLEQKNDFWRYFSKRIWSYDDFSFTQAPAAASLIEQELRFKIWFNPFLTYQMMITSAIRKSGSLEKDDTIVAIIEQEWMAKQLSCFYETGKFDDPSISVDFKEYGIDHSFYVGLCKSNENGEWTEDCWKQHCNMIVTNTHYNKNLIALMQHEMLHIMWEHIIGHGEKDSYVYNLATDYAINQNVKFSNDLNKILVTDQNPIFYNMFTIGIAKWKAKKSIEDMDFLNSLGLNIDSDISDFKKNVSKLKPYFMYKSNGILSLNTVLYKNLDSEFYYDILIQLKEELNGTNGICMVDSHIIWDEESEDVQDSEEDQDDCTDIYAHAGFKNIIAKNEVIKSFKAAAEAAGFNTNSAEDLERALNSIPGMQSFRKMFHEWFNVATKNWKKELKRFLRQCANPTALDYTMMREHRALDDVFPGKKRDLGFELILAIDTSGSISGVDFNDFIAQVHKISKDCDIKKIRVIQCHTRISSDEMVSIGSAKKLKELSIKETGGTAMQPVFEKLKREKNKLPLILFTDGKIDHFSADTYNTFKHMIFLSRGNQSQKYRLENAGFTVLCQDYEKKD